MSNTIDIYRETTCGDICLLYNRVVGIAIDEELYPFEPDNLAGWAEESIAPAIQELGSLDSNNPEDILIAEDFVATYFYGVVASELDKEIAKQDSSLQYLGSYCPSEQVSVLFDAVLELIYDGSLTTQQTTSTHTIH